MALKTIEMQIITKRQIPKEIIETFNQQTSRDFSIKILMRYPQKWRMEDLNIDFPLRIIPQKLFYSTGTRYGLCSARNELLAHAESGYVLSLDDFFIIPPSTIESLLPHLNENLIICSVNHRAGPEWERGLYHTLFKDMEPKDDFRVFQFDDCRPCTLSTGCMLFPMKALRKVNGWDLAYDGAWGGDDGDLAKRMLAAKVKYACFSSWHVYQLKHKFSSLEKDDPQSCSGFFIVNKETGMKIDINGRQVCLRGIPGRDDSQILEYFKKMHRFPSNGYAKFGLKEVRGLL